jgi:hypothetical protein
VNRFDQLVCIHTTGVVVALVGGALMVAGWMPPFSPATAGQHALLAAMAAEQAS